MFLDRQALYLYRGEAEILRLAGNDLARVDLAISTAVGEAKSYLYSSRYRNVIDGLTPSTTPEILKAKVAVLAHRGLATGPQVSQALENEAAATRTWLRDVARGTAGIGLSDPAARPVESSTPLFLSTHTVPESAALTWEGLEDW